MVRLGRLQLGQYLLALLRQLLVDGHPLLPEAGKVDGTRQLAAESLGGRGVEVLPTKVVQAADLHKLHAFFEKLELRDGFDVQFRVGQGCLLGQDGGRRIAQLVLGHSQPEFDEHQKHLPNSILVTVGLGQLVGRQGHPELRHAVDDVGILEEGEGEGLLLGR